MLIQYSALSNLKVTLYSNPGRCALESVDSGCPNQHYNKYVDTVQGTEQLKGHPLFCSNDGEHAQLIT